jgi:hypothetical protein
MRVRSEEERSRAKIDEQVEEKCCERFGLILLEEASDPGTGHGTGTGSANSWSSGGEVWISDHGWA